MKTLALLFALLTTAAHAQCVCLSCINPRIDSWTAAAGSMEPTLPVGSCFRSLRTDDAASIPPGTIITFRHPTRDISFVKRLIAVGGQTVQMRDGQLVIDGTSIPQFPQPAYVRPFIMHNGSLPRCANGRAQIGDDCKSDQFSETLGTITYNVLSIGMERADNTGIYTVPDGHVFVMGDNRDNSTDSRMPHHAGGVGFVPLTNIIGTVIP